MNRQQFQFSYTEYDSAEALSAGDRQLLDAATKATELAFAPYSHFHVGAAAMLSNGEVISGGNQENVSFPAGLCAEGVVLANAATRFPGVKMDALAITYRSSISENVHPIAPCGICRQSMDEFCRRTGSEIRLILGGPKGKIIVIENAGSLLPLAFRF